MRTAVAVLDFGGPRGPEELEPFLTNLLADVLPGPMPIKRLVAPRLARSRAKKVGPSYAQIGWSPLVKTHEAQVAALRAELGPDGPPLVSGMMFTPPTMREAARQLKHLAPERIVALPMFPHYSLATTGTAFAFFWEALEAEGLAHVPVHWIGAYFEHPLYLEALAATIREGVARTPGDPGEDVHLVFTPHGLPLSFVRRGDPYPDQIRATARRVMETMAWTGPWHLGWQSRVGPVQWLSPSTPEVLEDLARRGAKRVCLVPISFAAEHIETLHEIDIEYRHLAEQLGIAHFGRAPALGLQPAFVACLADRVRDAIDRFGGYACVRCLHPKPDAHRRRAGCPNCRFETPRYLRESRAGAD